MKAFKNTMLVLNNFTRLMLLLALVMVLTNCQQEVREWEIQNSQLVITEYVENNPEQFSEFGGILKATGIENLLRVRGPFTLLLPTNDALNAYYSAKGVSSYTQIEVAELETLVYNHIFQGEINSGVIGLGTLPYKNGLGDFVASDLPGQDILLNKTAKIIKRDIQVSNGYIQYIDKVLEPIERNVYQVLVDDGGYTLFTQGLEKAGLKDTLELIDFDYGASTARTRFTLFAVPDTLFNRMGIETIDDLIQTYSNGGDLTAMTNGFYQYMEFHCISGTHYFSDFQPDDIYYLISYENYINIKVEEDFKINESDDTYTGFYFDNSNIPAKNGAIHTVNTLMPNVETEPATIVFQTTDFFDLQQGPYYLNYYQRFYDGQNTFKNLKWDAEYLLYYLKPAHYLMDDDAINLNGHFWVELTTPKIRKGKYSLSTFMFFGTGYAVSSCMLDGEFLGRVDPSEGTWGGSPIVIGEVEFEETTTHTIRLQSIVPGGLFWDRVEFVPL